MVSDRSAPVFLLSHVIGPRFHQVLSVHKADSFIRVHDPPSEGLLAPHEVLHGLLILAKTDVPPDHSIFDIKFNFSNLLLQLSVFLFIFSFTSRQSHTPLLLLLIHDFFHYADPVLCDSSKSSDFFLNRSYLVLESVQLDAELVGFVVSSYEQ